MKLGEFAECVTVTRHMTALGEMVFHSSRAPDANAETLVFVHGWPFNAKNYRHLHRLLKDDFHCVMVDWPGMGASVFDPVKGKAINFTAMAREFAKLLSQTQKSPVTLIGHDTGATTLRLMLSEYDVPVKKLICLSTEIPGHRPAFIPFYQKSMRLPLSGLVLKLLFKSDIYLRSAMGFKHGFTDLNNMNADFKAALADRLLREPSARAGLRRYLFGIEWDVVDRLADIHAKIKQPVHYLWSADDGIFPVDQAKAEAERFQGDVTFTEIPGAGFLAIEECPEKIADIIKAEAGRGL